MRKDRSLLPVISAMTLLALSGCSAGGEGALAKRSTSPGSWSEEVQQAYDKATDAAIKQTLRDGRISDQEYSEMKQRYSDCLKGGGITLKRYDFEGSEYVPPTSMSSDEAHDIESRCSDQSGEYPISYFYVQMRANPTHSNLAQAVVDCFKRRGLVGPGYGLKDYQAGDLPTSNDKAVAACSTDPNGLLGG